MRALLLAALLAAWPALAGAEPVDSTPTRVDPAELGGRGGLSGVVVTANESESWSSSIVT